MLHPTHGILRDVRIIREKTYQNRLVFTSTGRTRGKSACPGSATGRERAAPVTMEVVTSVCTDIENFIVISDYGVGTSAGTCCNGIGA